jgi:hypothetical protein
MLGLQTVLNGGWEHDDIFIPPGFLRNAWNLFLPKGSSSVLLSVMCYVIQGYAKEELIESMIVEERELFLTPFCFESGQNSSQATPDTYQQTLARETEIKAILERSGFAYPKNIEEFIYLFIHIGIVFEVNYRGAVFLDIVVAPFPSPEEGLALTAAEKEEMVVQRRLQATSNPNPVS